MVGIPAPLLAGGARLLWSPKAQASISYGINARASKNEHRRGGVQTAEPPTRCASTPRAPEKLGNKGSSRGEGRPLQRLNVQQDLMDGPDVDLAKRLQRTSGGPEDLRRIR